MWDVQGIDERGRTPTKHIPDNGLEHPFAICCRKRRGIEGGGLVREASWKSTDENRCDKEGIPVFQISDIMSVDVLDAGNAGIDCQNVCNMNSAIWLKFPCQTACP